MKTFFITDKEKIVFDAVVTHPLQSYEWGQFREKTGIQVLRIGFGEKDTLAVGFQMTVHTIPYSPFAIGYIPKSVIPTKEQLEEIKKIAKDNNCIFVQCEPDVKDSKKAQLTMRELGFVPSVHPLFTKFTFQLDLTQSEDELLKHMHPKTRYNIKVAKRHGVTVVKENSQQAFATYLQLTKETTVRQGFYAHTSSYHQLMWETLHTSNTNLQAHLFVAYFLEGKQKIPLTTWIVFTFHDKLYYPYGASSSKHREAMASTLMMWEVIRFGKKQGYKLFDMWGALGPHLDTKDPWYGFHRFKQGFGPELVSFVGSYDLILNPLAYTIFKVINSMRWFLLRVRKSL